MHVDVPRLREEVTRRAREVRDADRSVADGDQPFRAPVPDRRAIGLPPLVDRATQVRPLERLVDDLDPVDPRWHRIRLDEYHARESEGHVAARAHPEEADHTK